jgi:lipopolysaccharide/colanic/teichoic acid biosynthesis glycosyltransferase
MKRAFDIFGSTLGLVALSPLLACLAAAIKLDSRGPVLYKGPRVGINGKRFNILKFRSMVTNAEALGGSTTPEDDPRVTAVGRFLRANKLDELPQLWNVLTGDMSLVGPRPQVQWAVDLYTPEERLVLSVRPGITDYASLRFANEGEILKGSTDPDRDYMEKIHPEKMRLSLEYVRSRSFSGDLSIIAQTVGAVIRPLRN